MIVTLFAAAFAMFAAMLMPLPAAIAPVYIAAAAALRQLITASFAFTYAAAACRRFAEPLLMLMPLRAAILRCAFHHITLPP
jgi:ABC-type uncharacterized transport system fused permease/ATPase subunit